MTKTLMYYISKGIKPTLIRKYLSEVFEKQLESPLTIDEVNEAIGYILADLHKNQTEEKSDEDVA